MLGSGSESVFTLQQLIEAYGLQPCLQLSDPGDHEAQAAAEPSAAHCEHAHDRNGFPWRCSGCLCVLAVWKLKLAGPHGENWIQLGCSPSSNMRSLRPRGNVLRPLTGQPAGHGPYTPLSAFPPSSFLACKSRNS